MIIEFSVKNFRSIKELQTISFASSGLKSPKEYSYIDTENITKIETNKIFKTIGIYGANASGKSNILKALDSFIKVVTNEPSSLSNMEKLCDPFLFQSDCESSESFFQIVLYVNNQKFRYGFTVKKNTESKPEDSSKPYSSEIITNEWLIGKKERNIGELFTRTGRDVKNYLPISQAIPAIPYEHSLFISHVAAYDNNNDCQTIRAYLRNMVTSNIDSDNHEKFRWLSVNFISNLLKEESKEDFLKLFSTFNLNYEDIELEKEPELNKVYPQDKITFHKKFSSSKNDFKDVILNLYKNESSGTQKLFDIAGLLLRAFRLNAPAIIILDEIDSNFHPALLIRLVKLFNTPLINKSNSQLLFTSHDTNLMSPSIMRRDQFYFTEKNEDNSTRLYSLSDLKGIRNDADFAKQYLAGYYGALPILEDYSQIKNSTNE
jgi:AAA15 family ATPase/GTPase